MVQLDDLKPEPTLWHEDTGRRPYENGRYALHFGERSMPNGMLNLLKFLPFCVNYLWISLDCILLCFK